MKKIQLFTPALALAASCNMNKNHEKQDPNIILIMVDDMGYSDLGCFGSEIQTPNIDKLAEEGIRFIQFYNTAKSYPSRASLLTGLYAHQAGIHESTSALKSNCITIAEILKQNGYNTFMTGKWHLGETPVIRGFDRYFGPLAGGCNYFDPGYTDYNNKSPNDQQHSDISPWGIDEQILPSYRPESDSFYTTDAFTNYAIQYLKKSKENNHPFFLYLAYTAPHYPLQAFHKDIEKYKETYLKGWDIIRKERHQRMINLGIVDETWKLSKPDKNLRSWGEVEDKELEAMKMAVFAAMIDRVDQNVGRLMSKLEELKLDKNTIVFFLSDNGGCASTISYTPDIMPGSKESYYGTGFEWANVSCTPFYKYKDWSHEGGISTPLIVNWPEKIRKKGSFIREPGHIIDIPATILDITGIEYPETRNGEKLLPLEGKSLLPLFIGDTRTGHEQLFWEFQNGKAIREGNWKLVQEINSNEWALFDVENDRTETINLIKEHPEVASKLLNDWIEWAVYSNVTGFQPYKISTEPIILESPYFSEKELTVSLENILQKTIRVSGNFAENSRLSITPHAFNVEVMPGQTKKVKVQLDAKRKVDYKRLPAIHLRTACKVDFQNGVVKPYQKRVEIYPESKLSCKKTNNNYIVDGDLQDWANLNIRFSKSWHSEVSNSDNSVWFNTTYNDSFVFIGVKILDNKVLADKAKQPWEQDGIEIRIDGRADPERSNHMGVRDFIDHLLVAMSPSETGKPAVVYNPDVYLHWYRNPNIFPPEGMKYACKIEHQGYQAELAIPVEYFTQRQGSDWNAFRLNLIIHDNDGEKQTRMLWRPDWRDHDSFVGSGTFFID